MTDISDKTISSFGDEWTRFNQRYIDESEANRLFDSYFKIFPWHSLSSTAEGFDMGCGSGRWARLVAPRVGILHCIDPSNAIDVARENLLGHSNVLFHRSPVSSCGLQLNSQDFGYCLGVLHHVPNTSECIRTCVDLLKPGAPFLLYLYYSFDNRPLWYRYLWRLSNIGRLVISTMPPLLKQLTTDLIALTIYWPFAKLSLLLKSLGLPVSLIPLSYYRTCSLFTMRTDSRDRFGTPLEKRFSRAQIQSMCEDAGLVDLRFSNTQPFWCVLGFKAPN